MTRSKLSLDQLNRLSAEDYSKLKKNPIIVVADNIRSAMNIGSLFRTCDAFAIEKLVLTGISARPPHKEINKTAIGATETVVWEYTDNIISMLNNYKAQDYRIVSVEQATDAVDLAKYSYAAEGRYVLIFGNEVSGVADDIINISDDCIEIKQWGTKHSLNVSVCAGIVLWSFTNKLLE